MQIEATAAAPAVAEPNLAMSWLKEAISPGTLLTVAAIVCGQIYQHGVQIEHTDGIEKRLSIIESHYVPREEHEKNDTWLRDELREIKRQLDNVENVLMRNR